MIIKIYNQKDFSKMNKNKELLVGTLVVICAFIFSVLMFEVWMFLATVSDFKKLLLAFIVIGFIIACIIRNKNKKETRN